MRGLDKIAEAVGGLRDRVHAVGRRRFALSSLREVVDCIVPLERHTRGAPGDSSPLAEAVDRGLGRAENADAALPAVAARVLSEHVRRMEVCPGGERLRAALLRCLAAVGEGRRPYREAEPALRAAIGEIDSEVWRRGHGGAETALGKACGILAELTPEGSAKRAADEAKRVRLTQRKPVAVAVEQRPEPVRSEPEAAPVVAAAEEAGPADDREQAAREVRRAARREPPGLWRPLRSIQELEEWVSY